MKHQMKWFAAALIIVFFASPMFADVGGPVYANKWFTTPPAKTLSNVADLTQTTDRVSKNQTVYFSLSKVGGDWYTVQNAALSQICDPTSATDGCTSAPLFIASEGATVCVDANDTDNATNNVNVSSYTCPVGGDNRPYDCLLTNSVWNQNVLMVQTTDVGRCFEANRTGIDVPRRDSGGLWIYFRVSTTPTADSVNIWVTGH